MKTLFPQLILFPTFIWLVWCFDIWTAISLFFPAYVIFTLITCGLLLIPYAFSKQISGIAIPLMWLFLLLSLPFVNNSSLKPFIRGYNDLRKGMSREEVTALLQTPYTGTRFPLPTIHSEENWTSGPNNTTTTRLCIKPQGREPGLQAECLIVIFKGGKLDHFSYSPD